KILYLFQYYDVLQRLMDRNRDLIERLCDCVLEVSDKAYFGDKRGFISFDDEAQEDAIIKCKRLANSMSHPIDYEQAADTLIDALLSVRNARVHASVRKPEEPEELPIGGESYSSVTIRGAIKESHEHDTLPTKPDVSTPEPEPPIRRHDYEIHVV